MPTAATAGKLRHRVTITRPPDPVSAARDSFGQLTGDYSTVATVWGSYEPLSGREYWQAQQVQADVTGRVWLRWSSLTAGMDPTWRLTVLGKTLEVLAVTDEEGRRRMLRVDVKEIAGVSSYLLDESGGVVLDQTGSPIWG